MDREQGDVRGVRLAIRRDPEAIRALWREHRGWIAGVLLAHKPRGVELEDLLQDVALTMVRKIDEVRDPRAIRGWLRSIALNAALAQGRERSRRQRLDRDHRLRLVSEDGEASESSRDPARVEEGERLLEIARELPEGYREPLILRCVRGMTYRQIASAMDLPETTVETRIARGRRMLREILARRERSSGDMSRGAMEELS